jgi:hypothetical protein
MWKRKPKYKEIDENLVETIKYGLPGIHVKDMIPLDRIYGKDYLWGFVPNKRQPKLIVEILLEQLREKKRNSQT